jgi:hypothetical protein
MCEAGLRDRSLSGAPTQTRTRDNVKSNVKSLAPLTDDAHALLAMTLIERAHTGSSAMLMRAESNQSESKMMKS